MSEAHPPPPCATQQQPPQHQSLINVFQLMGEHSMRSATSDSSSHSPQPPSSHPVYPLLNQSTPSSSSQPQPPPPTSVLASSSSLPSLHLLSPPAALSSDELLLASLNQAISTQKQLLAQGEVQRQLAQQLAQQQQLQSLVNANAQAQQRLQLTELYLQQQQQQQQQQSSGFGARSISASSAGSTPPTIGIEFASNSPPMSFRAMMHGSAAVTPLIGSTSVPESPLQQQQQFELMNLCTPPQRRMPHMQLAAAGPAAAAAASTPPIKLEDPPQQSYEGADEDDDEEEEDEEGSGSAFVSPTSQGRSLMHSTRPSSQRSPHARTSTAAAAAAAGTRTTTSPTGTGCGPIINGVRSKRGQGVSCHSCKTSKDSHLLIYCQNKGEKHIKKRRCRKKYCETCLKRSYPTCLPQEGEALTWMCPSCLALCLCASCMRREAEKALASGGVVPSPAAASPARGASSHKKNQHHHQHQQHQHGRVHGLVKLPSAALSAAMFASSSASLRDPSPASASSGAHTPLKTEPSGAAATGIDEALMADLYGGIQVSTAGINTGRGTGSSTGCSPSFSGQKRKMSNRSLNPSPIPPAAAASLNDRDRSGSAQQSSSAHLLVKLEHGQVQGQGLTYPSDAVFAAAAAAHRDPPIMTMTSSFARSPGQPPLHNTNTTVTVTPDGASSAIGSSNNNFVAWPQQQQQNHARTQSNNTNVAQTPPRSGIPPKSPYLHATSGLLSPPGLRGSLIGSSGMTAFLLASSAEIVAQAQATVAAAGGVGGGDHHSRSSSRGQPASPTATGSAASTPASPFRHMSLTGPSIPGSGYSPALSSSGYGFGLGSSANGSEFVSPLSRTSTIAARGEQQHYSHGSGGSNRSFSPLSLTVSPHGSSNDLHQLQQEEAEAHQSWQHATQNAQAAAQRYSLAHSQRMRSHLQHLQQADHMSQQQTSPSHQQQQQQQQLQQHSPHQQPQQTGLVHVTSAIFSGPALSLPPNTVGPLRISPRATPTAGHSNSSAAISDQDKLRASQQVQQMQQLQHDEWKRLQLQQQIRMKQLEIYRDAQNRNEQNLALIGFAAAAGGIGGGDLHGDQDARAPRRKQQRGEMSTSASTSVSPLAPSDAGAHGHYPASSSSSFGNLQGSFAAVQTTNEQAAAAMAAQQRRFSESMIDEAAEWLRSQNMSVNQVQQSQHHQHHMSQPCSPHSEAQAGNVGFIYPAATGSGAGGDVSAPPQIHRHYSEPSAAAAGAGSGAGVPTTTTGASELSNLLAHSSAFAQSHEGGASPAPLNLLVSPFVSPTPAMSLPSRLRSWSDPMAGQSTFFMHSSMGMHQDQDQQHGGGHEHDHHHHEGNQQQREEHHAHGHGHGLGQPHRQQLHHGHHHHLAHAHNSPRGGSQLEQVAEMDGAEEASTRSRSGSGFGAPIHPLPVPAPRTLPSSILLPSAVMQRLGSGGGGAGVGGNGPLLFSPLSSSSPVATLFTASPLPSASPLAHILGSVRPFTPGAGAAGAGAGLSINLHARVLLEPMHHTQPLSSPSTFLAATPVPLASLEFGRGGGSDGNNGGGGGDAQLTSSTSSGSQLSSSPPVAHSSSFSSEDLASPAGRPRAGAEDAHAHSSSSMEYA